MRVSIFTSLLFFCFVSANLAAQKIAVVNPTTGATNFYATINQAVTGASAGDYIYLPGGLVSGTAVSISKKLNIIGAGYHPDSSRATEPTQLGTANGSTFFTFLPGAQGSLLTGVYLNGNIVIGTGSVDNITLSRCNLYAIAFSGHSSNVLITECIIRENISRPAAITFSNVLISNSVIGQQVSSITSGVAFKNNLFLSQTAPFINSTSSLLLENNVFLTISGLFSNNNAGGSMFRNNLFAGPASLLSISGVSANVANVFSEPLSNIFADYTSGAELARQNFHLKPGCRGIGLGTDGTDAGIYGSNMPWKDGAAPFIPRIREANISPATGPDGKLNISISVEAQSR